MQRIALEGIDGAGKTSVSHEIVELCKEEGRTCRVISPFQIANETLGTEIYPLWKSFGGAAMASEVLIQITSNETIKAENDGIDLLIFDRHWATAFTEIACMPKLTYLWRDHMILTALLKVTPDVALARSSADELNLSWMDDRSMANYAKKYSKIFINFYPYFLGQYRSDDDVSPNDIAENILWDLRIRR